MKTASFCIVIFLAGALHPFSTNAQFFKNLVNAATQSATNHAANKAVPASGKPDSTAAKSGMDSARLAQLLAGMSNPNKGKPSVSPADSAAAIKSFMTATGGSGLFYQYHVIYDFTTKQKDSTVSDTMSMAISDSRNAHVEFGLLGMKMATLGHAGMPKYSITLYPKNKTYVLNIIDTAAINAAGGQTYTVTKIGNETVQGYSCIHSKLTVNSGKTAQITEDVWTSTSVPGYTQLEKMMTVQNVTPKMLQALEQAGCAGFFVKMTMQSKSISMSMLLVTADRKTFPASMFEIPSGYTQGSSMSMLLGMMGAHQ